MAADTCTKAAVAKVTKVAAKAEKQAAGKATKAEISTLDNAVDYGKNVDKAGNKKRAATVAAAKYAKAAEGASKEASKAAANAAKAEHLTLDDAVKVGKSVEKAVGKNAINKQETADDVHGGLNGANNGAPDKDANNNAMLMVSLYQHCRTGHYHLKSSIIIQSFNIVIFELIVRFRPTISSNPIG